MLSLLQLLKGAEKLWSVDTVDCTMDYHHNMNAENYNKHLNDDLDPAIKWLIDQLPDNGAPIVVPLPYLPHACHQKADSTKCFHRANCGV